MEDIRIFIHQKPIALKRPRKAPSGHIYDSQKKEKQTVMAIFKRVMEIEFKNSSHRLEGPLMIEFSFKFKGGKEKDIFHTKKPDIDNLCKFYLDCMNDVIFKDDSQVAVLYAKKISGHEKDLVAISITQIGKGAY